MQNDNSPNTLAVTDAWCLLIGLALGVGFGTLIHVPAVGIGSGVAISVASNMARRRGSQGWMGWMGLYAVLVLIAYALNVTGILK